MLQYVTSSKVLCVYNDIFDARQWRIPSFLRLFSQAVLQCISTVVVAETANGYTARELCRILTISNMIKIIAILQ